MDSAAEITKRSGSNLALAFVALPKEKKKAMVSLYAFCREVDDIADNTDATAEDRGAELRSWREAVHSIYQGNSGSTGIGVIDELSETIREYRLRLEDFDALMDGVDSDVVETPVRCWDDLETYCYRVASAVGLLSIPIFGYNDPKTRDYAIALGKALQLTNILRDVADDAALGRVYLPEALLEEYGVPAEAILGGLYSAEYERLAHSVAERATEFYSQANAILPAEDRRRMVAAELMGAVYWKLLRKLYARDFNVFSGKRVRLNKTQKLLEIVRVYARVQIRGSSKPNYGPERG